MTPESSLLRDTKLRPVAGAVSHKPTVIGDPWNDECDPLAETLPPTPLQDLLKAEGATVHVLSSDPQLLDIVQSAAGERYPLIQAASFSELLQAVESRRCGIALIDADPRLEDLDEQVRQLYAVGQPLVLIFAASASHVADLDGQLAQRSTEPLIVKSCSVELMQLRLTWAVDRLFELRNEPEAQPAPAAASVRPAKPRPTFLLGAVAAVVLSAAAGGLVAWLSAGSKPDTRGSTERSAGAEVAGATAPAASPTANSADIGPAPAASPTANSADIGPAPAASPTANTADIGPAPAARRPSVASTPASQPPRAPAANSAEAVASAATDPSSAPPGSMAQQPLGSDATELADKLDTLISLIGELDPETLALLPSLLEKEKQKATASPQMSPPVGAPAPPSQPAPQAPLLLLAGERLAAGQLLEPQGDSASEYLQRAAALAPGDRRVAELREELIDALLVSADDFLAADDLNTTEQLLGAAVDLGASDEAVSALETELSAARRADAQQAAQLARARELIAAGRLLQPAGNSAWDLLEPLQAEAGDHLDVAAMAAEFSSALALQIPGMLADSDWPAAERALSMLRQLDFAPDRVAALETTLTHERRQAELLVISAPLTDLAVVTYQPPVYPRGAVRRGIEGWVELRFVINEQGAPEAITITAAEPPDVFDEAVLAAVSDYRFEPYQRDGRVYRRAAHTRVSFELTE